MAATRILPWAAVLVTVIAGISILSFSRRGDPAWDDTPAPALEAQAADVPAPAAPASVTLRSGLPASGRLEIDISSIQGEQTGQRGVHSGWRLQADGTVVLNEPLTAATLASTASTSLSAMAASPPAARIRPVPL